MIAAFFFVVFAVSKSLRVAFGEVVGPDAVGEVVVEEFFGFEPEGEFGLGGLGGVGAVDEVEGGGDAVVAADGAGLGFEAEGGAHHFAGDVDDAFALEGEDDDGGGGHEADEAVVEGFAFVGGVVFGGEFFGDHHEFHADDLDALFLEAGDDFADEGALDGVGFEDDEGAFHDLPFLEIGLTIVSEEGWRQKAEHGWRWDYNGGLCVIG